MMRDYNYRAFSYFGIGDEKRVMGFHLWAENGYGVREESATVVSGNAANPPMLS